MERTADESVVKEMNPLNTPEQPPTKEDSEMSNRETREKYFSELRTWLTTVNNYQCFYNELMHQSVQKKNEPSVPSNNAPETPNVASTQFVGIRCQIPSLWKRFGAEVIDLIIMGLIEFVLAYFAIDVFNIIDLPKFMITLLKDYSNSNNSTVVELTARLIALEISHRISICFYEIYWLHGSVILPCGGTIGKNLLDLTIVRAEKLYNIRGQPNDIIALTPGCNLGWKRSIIRSLSKNLFFSFMFPLPFITAAANQNRCTYDVLSETMVVEALKPLTCDQSELIPIA